MRLTLAIAAVSPVPTLMLLPAVLGIVGTRIPGCGARPPYTDDRA
ncbi:MAG TPA: hypothetical protein VGJ59_12615 [Jatrophihabitantaceae bacterium]|jgi:hypothetical protein